MLKIVYLLNAIAALQTRSVPNRLVFTLITWATRSHINPRHGVLLASKAVYLFFFSSLGGVFSLFLPFGCGVFTSSSYVH